MNEEERLKRNAYARERYRMNPQRQLTANKRWRERNPEKAKAAMKRYSNHSRERLFDAIGDRCTHCGITERCVLQLDHIHNNGYKDLKRFGNTSSMYNYYVKQPDEAKKTFQILCANCNWRKRAKRKT